MALTSDDIFNHPQFHGLVREQSGRLVGMFESDARLAAVFATQQRWLMSHAGLALYFRAITERPGAGFQMNGFLDVVRRHGLASRNTADAYIKEMIKYKYVTVLPPGADKRMKPLAPATNVLEALDGWLRVHLMTLDSLAGGDRLARYLGDPSRIASIQPLVADALITARAVRNPTATFSLFTWLDNGGLIMDWLIKNMDDSPLDSEHTLAGEVSIVEMATRLNLSRTHLSRKLREAEDMGSIGWTGKRGRSEMWVSRGFRQEYLGAQAIKLAIIDQACSAVLPS